MYAAIAAAAATRTGANDGQSLRSIRTGASGAGNATSPPKISSPTARAAANASARSRGSEIEMLAPSAEYQEKKEPAPPETA